MSHLLTFSRGVLGRAAVGRAAVCMVCGASRAPDAVDAVRGYTRTRTLATTVVLALSARSRQQSGYRFFELEAASRGREFAEDGTRGYARRVNGLSPKGRTLQLVSSSVQRLSCQRGKLTRGNPPCFSFAIQAVVGVPKMIRGSASAFDQSTNSTKIECACLKEALKRAA